MKIGILDRPELLDIRKIRHIDPYQASYAIFSRCDEKGMAEILKNKKEVYRITVLPAVVFNLKDYQHILSFAENYELGDDITAILKATKKLAAKQGLNDPMLDEILAIAESKYDADKSRFCSSAWHSSFERDFEVYYER